METKEPVIIVESYYQALKVRLVFWFLLACGALAVWGGWAIFQTYGLSEADGGILRPLWQRIAFGGFVASLGLAFAGGMWLYLSLYALHISREGDVIHITTMTPIGQRNREFPISDIGEGAYYHGRVQHVLETGASGGIWTNAPWITLRARGHRLPFIIDLQAELLEIGMLSMLAEGSVNEWQKDGK